MKKGTPIPKLPTSVILATIVISEEGGAYYRDCFGNDNIEEDLVVSYLIESGNLLSVLERVSVKPDNETLNRILDEHNNGNRRIS